VRDSIKEAIARTFGLAVQQVPDDVTSEQLEEWDSLHHLELMLELELSFGVTITSDAMPDLLSIDAIEAYIREHTGQPAA
jgi:acyl carrier protein